MLRISIKTFFLIGVITLGCIAAAAQNTGSNSLLDPKDDDKSDTPSGMRDMLKKMEIEKEKKDFEEMQNRGKQVLAISDELEKSIQASNKLSEKDRARLETLEKLVKKIRGELGGSDDAGPEKNDVDYARKPADVIEGLKFLRVSTVKFVDDLKKTSRFTVSLAAIQASNAVLRLTRFVKFWK